MKTQAKPEGENKRPVRVYGNNRHALFEYAILESIEVGIALTGTEVKSIRSGHVNLREAYARIERGELWLHNCHIAPYEQGNRYNHEPRRPRKLLAHKREIGRLAHKASEPGNTLIPMRVYSARGHIKVELAVARGKRQYDKRQAIAEREAKRDIDRALKQEF
jgi:SsrA-binding protein